jgi:hypothetical protein
MLAQSMRPKRSSNPADRRRADLGADGGGAVGVGIDDADELDAGQGRVLLGVERAEVTDADDGGADRVRHRRALRR